jgi:hypothetical protein
MELGKSVLWQVLPLYVDEWKITGCVLQLVQLARCQYGEVRDTRHRRDEQ